MLVRSVEEFKNVIFKVLDFNKYKYDNYNLYTNKDKPELGHLISYSRENYYDLGIANYTFPKNFSLTFDNPELLVRFGLVYKGNTEFKLEDGPVSSFTPSSFFVVEQNLKGQQNWKTNDHFRGIEITIHECYFNEVIKANFPKAMDIDFFLKNYTYTYLPLEVINIIIELQSLATENSLTSLYLEAKILECLAILMNEISKSPENAFTNQINHGKINLGTNRTINLTSSDIRGLLKAREILSKEYSTPPNIATLSKMVFLNEQKLKAGFSKQYHMSIGEYTNHIRMSVAANLLSTTDLSIEAIANKVGYYHSGNLSRMFKKHYGKTPLQFRKMK